uniref:Uncharacterized protein n=1 Tax=Chromera velia CCMP2878 TaxID=1169474 RepID=A0A0G4FD48_9ALVE|mmetsp:Transcript_34850/g.68799  ORF Transcript_34850/g.68799 Transcript_34850/m.68799 type:complete len:387 (+) Transcript_34850:307-1467(+)|eukprot:Cvel_16410.t1-p1 / transcript=Cvel_16410.t1 / gene=Cvel_16410 / organism=Chromera_velia_CCMP2878 / gene_product=hypothetical protein / transcript_product=hypothetical protein / location=Cvel_scaffold1263:22030-26044(-) / protein_length=386 / sequence_SO=supercontig / SO=protein_coding / is_pseudo=false
MAFQERGGGGSQAYLAADTAGLGVVGMGGRYASNLPHLQSSATWYSKWCPICLVVMLLVSMLICLGRPDFNIVVYLLGLAFWINHEKDSRIFWQSIKALNFILVVSLFVDLLWAWLAVNVWWCRWSSFDHSCDHDNPMKWQRPMHFVVFIASCFNFFLKVVLIVIQWFFLYQKSVYSLPDISEKNAKAQWYDNPGKMKQDNKIWQAFVRENPTAVRDLYLDKHLYWQRIALVEDDFVSDTGDVLINVTTEESDPSCIIRKPDWRMEDEADSGRWNRFGEDDRDDVATMADDEGAPTQHQQQQSYEGVVQTRELGGRGRSRQRGVSVRSPNLPNAAAAPLSPSNLYAHHPFPANPAYGYPQNPVPMTAVQPDPFAVSPQVPGAYPGW